MSNNNFVHVDIATKNSAASGKFYAEIFGWEITHMAEYNYTMFKGPDTTAGGFINIDNETYKEGDVIVYINVADLDATVAKIIAAGGKITQPKMEIPGVGWFAFFTDPSNTRLALLQPLPRS